MAEVELLELYRTEADDARRGTSRAWVAALRHAGEEAKRLRDAIFESQLRGRRANLRGKRLGPTLDPRMNRCPCTKGDVAQSPK